MSNMTYRRVSYKPSKVEGYSKIEQSFVRFDCDTISMIGLTIRLTISTTGLIICHSLYLQDYF